MSDSLEELYLAFKSMRALTRTSDKATANEIIEAGVAEIKALRQKVKELKLIVDHEVQCVIAASKRIDELENKEYLNWG